MAQNSIVIKFLADVDGINKGISQTNAKLTGFERSTKAIGLAIAGAFAVDKVVAAGKAIIDAASNLEQAAGASKAVFGPEASKVIDDWSRKAAAALGLSATDALTAATRFATAGKQMNLTGDELVRFSQQMTQNGADLAAMFGGTVPTAVDALSAALRGEFDPLERYGIALNQAAIDAEAAALGFQKVNGQWEQAAKSSAISSLIQKQMELNGATGAFARESDTYAGQVARLSAEWENFQATLGQAVLPLVTRLVSGLRVLLDFVQQNSAAIYSLGAIALVAAGRVVILRNAVLLNGALSSAVTLWQGMGLAVQLLGVRAATAGIAMGALAATGPWILLASTIGLVVTGITLMTEQARKTDDEIRRLGLEDERAAGKVRTNTAIIGAAMKKRAELAGDAANATGSTWNAAFYKIAKDAGLSATSTANSFVAAANVIINAANQAGKAWEAGQNAAKPSYLSGTVSSAIAAEGRKTPWVSFSEVTTGTVKRFEGVGTTLGSAAGGGIKSEVQKALKDLDLELDSIAVSVKTKMAKAGETLAAGYTDRLNVLKEAAKAYQQAVNDALVETDRLVKEKAKSITETFLGFSLSDFVKTNDDGTTFFDSEAFKKWMTDKEALSKRMGEAVGLVPSAWLEQIATMPNANANATLDWILGNKADAAETAKSYETLSTNVYNGMALPLAETYRTMFWEAQQAGIESAKQAVKDAADDFRQFVRKQLKTKVVIDVEYNVVGPVPSGVTGAGGRAAVAALQDYERLNGRSWRVS